jgi:hypothetical protein
MALFNSQQMIARSASSRETVETSANSKRPGCRVRAPLLPLEQLRLDQACRKYCAVGLMAPVQTLLLSLGGSALLSQNITIFALAGLKAFIALFHQN